MSNDPNNSERMDTLYKSHFKAVRAYCLRRLPAMDANDTTAEVFLAAWRRIEDVPIDERELPYLYGIARNMVSHAHRSTGRRRRLQEKAQSVARPESPIGPEATVMARAEADAIDAALAALRPADREIIQLRAWEELEPAQIAEALCISTAAAYKRLSRALDRLQTQLRRQEGHVPTSRKGGER